MTHTSKLVATDRETGIFQARVAYLGLPYAAAPELLEACKIVFAYSHAGIWEDEHGKPGMWSEDLAKVAAAIAKAEGKQ